MAEKLSVRIDKEIEMKIEYISAFLRKENDNLTRADLIRYLIEEKFNQLVGKESYNLEDEKPDDVNPDLLMVAEKVNYIFEYMELLLKADSEIKKFYTDINGKYDSEKIKKYVKSESYYRDFVTAKINKETDKNGQ